MGGDVRLQGTATAREQGRERQGQWDGPPAREGTNRGTAMRHATLLRGSS
ncbi:Hypothetical protein AA314_07679 [Archangium gephyra]|uniref:Uncharacterized protein n=1 Tax=Archangium gephyra TaxID=48 RepID=A0AAC8QEX0_9BACT|nr:Hypothetical protein AA314_07679 [Archangium gephyra]